MTRTYLNEDRAGPIWAVFGAPLVGVPLMVAVLALGSGSAIDSAVESEVGLVVEQVEMPEASQELDSESLRLN